MASIERPQVQERRHSSEIEEVGPEPLRALPHSILNLVSQVRQEYDEDDLLKLARSMISRRADGERYLHLIQAPTVTELSHDEAVAYIDKINSTFETEHSIDELTPISTKPSKLKRRYMVVVCGHRRTLAIPIAAALLGKDLTQLRVRCHIAKDKTYEQTKATQYKENMYKKPESWEDAYAINAILLEGLESGQYKHYVDCADDLSIDEDRVARAYRYVTLPDYVRAQVEIKEKPNKEKPGRGEILSFGRALMLSKLFVAIAFDDCQDQLDEEQKVRFTKMLKQNKLYLPDVMPFVSPERRASLDEKFLYYALEIIKKSSKERAQKYINERYDVYFSKLYTLSMVLGDYKEINEENDRAHRRATVQIAIDSLRRISSIFVGDAVRIKNERPSILADTQSLRAAWNTLNETMRTVINPNNLDDDQVIESLGTGDISITLLLRELEALDESDNVLVTSHGENRSS